MPNVAPGRNPPGSRLRSRESPAWSVNFSGPSDEANLTLTESELVIGQGDVPNFVLKLIGHITINANGEVTSQKFEFETKCRG